MLDLNDKWEPPYRPVAIFDAEGEFVPSAKLFVILSCAIRDTLPDTYERRAKIRDALFDIQWELEKLLFKDADTWEDAGSTEGVHNEETIEHAWKGAKGPLKSAERERLIEPWDRRRHYYIHVVDRQGKQKPGVQIYQELLNLYFSSTVYGKEGGQRLGQILLALYSEFSRMLMGAKLLDAEFIRSEKGVCKIWKQPPPGSRSPAASKSKPVSTQSSVSDANASNADALVTAPHYLYLFKPNSQILPLKEIEEQVIRIAIQYYKGRMTEVSRRLGIGRSTLYRNLGNYIDASGAESDLPELEKQSSPLLALTSAQTADFRYLCLFRPDGQMRRLDEIEWPIIQAAIERYKGCLTEVARRLGIGRSTLYRKLGEHMGEVAEEIAAGKIAANSNDKGGEDSLQEIPLPPHIAVRIRKAGVVL